MTLWLYFTVAVFPITHIQKLVIIVCLVVRELSIIKVSRGLFTTSCALLTIFNVNTPSGRVGPRPTKCSVFNHPNHIANI